MSEDNTIREREQEIISDFSLFDTWEEKYEYIIDLGKKLPPLDEKWKTEDNVIKGCQSTVWLVAQYRDGKVYYQADSNAVIVKGIISMLIAVLSGATPGEIVRAPLDFIGEIGMMNHLAQTRSNGLLAMIKQIKHYALAFQNLSETEKSIG